jgi:hypothetical protein
MARSVRLPPGPQLSDVHEAAGDVIDPRHLRMPRRTGEALTSLVARQSRTVCQVHGMRLMPWMKLLWR